MAGSGRSRESTGEMSSVDQAVCTSELPHHLDVLLNKEQDLVSRMKLLMSLASGCSSNPENFRAITDALQLSLTARWICWEDQRYTATETVEWRTSIAQAAANSKGPVKEVAKSLVWLGIKANCWYTGIATSDSQGRNSEREWPAGSLLKIQTAVTSLNISVLEKLLSTYSTVDHLLPDETLAPLVKDFISSAFAFVKVIYFSSTPSDWENQKKRCEEVLNQTSRLVFIFRRHIVGYSRGRIDLSNSQNLEDIAEKFPEIWLKQGFPLQVVSSSIRSLVELGDLSTKGGAGSLRILNISWKSVAALLSRDEGCDFVASGVDVTRIMTALLCHAVQSLKVPVQAFLSSPDSGEKDARRLSIPVKFFLQIAERLSLNYPHKAIIAGSSISLSLSKILASLLLEYGVARKADLQVFAELIIPSAVEIAHHLLKAESVEEEKKIELLRYITSDNDDLWHSHSIADLDGGDEHSEVLDELFSDKPNGLGLVKSGRFALYVSLLQVSSSCSSTPILLKLTLKMEWLLETILEPGVYALLTQTRFLPMWTAEGKVTWKHELMFTWISNSLQTFAGAVAKCDSVWTEFQHFLFENLLHPCAVCRELVLTVWCYIIRKSDADFAHKHVEALLVLLRDMISTKTDLSVPRRLARGLCVLLEEASEAEALFVYAGVFQREAFSSETASSLATLLLEEGYSFSLLNEGDRKTCRERFMSFCIASGKSLVDCLKEGRVSTGFHCSKQALVCLQLLLESASLEEEVEDMHLQGTLYIAQELLRMAVNEAVGSASFTREEVLSHGLLLIPHVQHLLKPSSVEKLLPKLLECCSFMSQNSRSKELKQSLPVFLASLSETTMTEDEGNPSVRALWGLYTLVLKEKHWALAHVGLASFSHFAARTSFQDLWRFVPEDAPVARNTGSDDSTKDAFLSALRSFIEKEMAQRSLIPSEEELKILGNEAAHLCKIKDRVSGTLSNGGVEKMDIDRVNLDSADIEEAFDVTRKHLDMLRKKIHNWLASVPSHSVPNQSQIIRTRLVDLKEEVDALQQLA
ncbi:hypothetical protein R1sor_003918 [Riccia sorocarpa]|uniref:Uncharacterized protein n=1 Tax=Riccia sorocarpa TaxID=122646 RepID=A0ABD3H4U0_9MARC